MKCVSRDGYSRIICNVSTYWAMLHLKSSVLYLKSSVLHFKSSVLHFKSSVFYLKSSVLHLKFSVLHLKSSVLLLKSSPPLWVSSQSAHGQGKYFFLYLNGFVGDSTVSWMWSLAWTQQPEHIEDHVTNSWPKHDCPGSVSKAIYFHINFCISKTCLP